MKTLCIFIETLINIFKSALPVPCAVRGVSEALYGQAPGEGIQVFREFDPDHRQTDRQTVKHGDIFQVCIAKAISKASGEKK